MDDCEVANTAKTNKNKIQIYIISPQRKGQTPLFLQQFCMCRSPSYGFYRVPVLILSVETNGFPSHDVYFSMLTYYSCTILSVISFNNKKKKMQCFSEISWWDFLSMQ